MFKENKNLMGCSITMPFKKEIIPFINKLVGDAAEIKVVNTIIKQKENYFIGFNTDIEGVLKPL